MFNIGYSKNLSVAQQFNIL